MVYLSKRDTDKVIKELSKVKKNEIAEIIKKMKSDKRAVYATSRIEIRKLLKQAFNDKKRVKIRYYSPHSDEHTTRVIDIYQIYINSIIAYCHLGEEERTFAIDRINRAILLNEKYTIPKNWEPESIISDSS